MRRLAAGVATAVIVSLAALASAQAPAAVPAVAPAPDVELGWSAPAGCPDRAAVEREIRALLQGSPAARHAVVARGTVTGGAGKWHVDLAIRTGEGSGERSFEAGSCAELASAVALIVALAVDPSRRLSERGAAAPDAAAAAADAAAPAPNAATADAATAADAAVPAAVVAPAPAPVVPPSSATSDEDGVRLAIGVDGVGELGALPSVSGGGGLAVALLFRRARLEARARLLASQDALDPAQPAEGVRLGLVGGGGRGCLAVVDSPRREVALAPCVGVEIDRLSAEGFGGAGSSALSGSGTWASGDGGLLLTWAPLRAFALRLDGELVVPFARPSFVVLAADGSVARVLHRPSPLGGRLGFGVELRFF
jgi:hypothetical protein